MKRQIAYFIVIFIGFFALMGHFINHPPLNDFIDNKKRVVKILDNVLND